MTRFGDKLRRRFGLPPEQAVPAADDLPDAVRQRAGPSPLGELLRRRQQRRALRAATDRVALPAGSDCCNEHGTFFLRRTTYPLASVHGRTVLSGAAVACFDSLAAAAQDPGLADVVPQQCLFFDTETTGLAGGAGTVVFLCGLGWIENDVVVVEQGFLRAFEEEAAMLHHVEQHLRVRPVLVSYVGKSFDRHRVSSRMAVHRMATRMLEAEHLDLYHLARRRYRDRHWPDTKLRTVEEEVLGLVRDDDLPGALAPMAWLDWLRDGSGPIDAVFEHNRLDVLSLVALLGVLGASSSD